MLNISHPLVAKLAEDATRAGLLLSQFNSGSPRNEANGFRLFLAEGAPWSHPDHFCGLHLYHAPTVEQAQAFVDGWCARQTLRVEAMA